METKNIIAAISLSAAVIILYSLFFAPSQDELNKIRAEKEKDKIVKNSESPSLDNEKNISTIKIPNPSNNILYLKCLMVVVRKN